LLDRAIGVHAARKGFLFGRSSGAGCRRGCSISATANTSLHDISIGHVDVSLDAFEEVVVLIESGRGRELTAFAICGGIALAGA
jgi:hypothetical protein